VRVERIERRMRYDRIVGKLTRGSYLQWSSRVVGPQLCWLPTELLV